MRNRLFKQNLRIAWNAIRAQKLRAILTMLIISLGIMALVGILTSIDALKASINDQFSSMGANSFTLEQRPESNIRQRGRELKGSAPIRFHEARSFGEMYRFPAVVSTSVRASRSETVKYKKEKTNPNITVFGSDEQYLTVKGRDLEWGRNFTAIEVQKGNPICLLGAEIAEELFDKADPLGHYIRVRNVKFEVVGVLKKKGSSMGFSGDRDLIIPLTSARQYFNRSNTTFNIHVLTGSPQQLEAATQEATGLFRAIRKDPLSAESSFRIRRSDSLSQRLIENLSLVTLAATAIGFITLLGAAIGLMNIMLVSVTERTREIGIRKAIGAKASTIQNQFLTEALLICQIGGVSGVILGMLIGNLVSFLVGNSFIIPWDWMITGVVLCLLVGVVAGFYPARKAALLDPIESLRYE